MAKTLDLGVSGRERLTRTRTIGREELQSRAGMRLHGASHPRSLAEIALRGAKFCKWHVGLAKPAMKQLELGPVFQHPANALESCRLLLVQDDGAGILVIAAKHHRTVRSLTHKLETNDVLVELARFLEVADVQLNVSEFLVADHFRFPPVPVRLIRNVLSTCEEQSRCEAPALRFRSQPLSAGTPRKKMRSD